MAQNPALIRAYKTAVFAIHNPSRHKRAMLDDALRRNHVAYTKALAAVMADVANYAAMKPRERVAAVVKRARSILQPLPLAISAKAGIASDVASQLESHLALRDKQGNASAPTASRLRSDELGWRAALDRLADSRTVEEENAARDDLAREARDGRYRPILLLANRVADGYLLLRHPETGDYYAFLNLHPRDSRFARQITVDGLVDIRTGEVMNFKTTTGALFPLAFARDYQLDCFIRKARPQSAKVVKIGERYEVHVTFEYETPRVEPVTHLGVDRGIYALAALAVIDNDGRLVASENIDGRELRHVQRVEERRQRHAQSAGRRYSRQSRREMADEAVHVTANRIVEVAREHGAQVVLENLRPLTDTGRRRGRSNFNRLLGRAQYEKLRAVLEYKLAVAGLPKSRAVVAAFTSQTCPTCGHRSPGNRLKRREGDGFAMDLFACERCGYRADADANAARVIALRLVWRAALPAGFGKKTNVELPENLRFEQFLRDRAERRGDGPGGRLAAVDTTGGRGLDGHEDGEVPPREQSRLSLNPDRTHRRKKKPAAMPLRLSSSSANPSLRSGDMGGDETG